MTIDEAIAHAKEKAKKKMAEYENHYDKDAHYYPRQCKRCAEEYEQLAEWLEELKAIKDGSIPIIHGKAELELHDKEIYNKAIDDFVESVKNLIADSSVIRFKDIDEIAEQLKASGENE